MCKRKTGWQPCKYENSSMLKSPKGTCMSSGVCFDRKGWHPIFKTASMDDGLSEPQGNGWTSTCFTLKGTIRYDINLSKESGDCKINSHNQIYSTSRQWREIFWGTGARQRDRRTMSWLRRKAKTTLRRKEVLDLNTSLSLCKNG